MATALPPAVQKKIAVLAKKGVTGNQIALKLGIDRSTANRYRNSVVKPHDKSAPQELRDKIASLGAEGLSNGEIARRLKIAPDTAGRYRGARPVAAKAEPVLADLHKLLKTGPKNVDEIAAAFDCTTPKVRGLIAEARRSGYLLHEHVGGKYAFTDALTLDKGHLTLKADSKGQHRYGFVTDTHLCNKHSRLDVLNEAYDFFASLGITKVLHAGNIVDGEARFNKTELIVAPGMQSQIDYTVQEYPHRPGITTYFIDGDDHEGWYYQREKVQFGKLLQNDARDAGRNDLVYLGYAEADIALVYNGHDAVARLVHPGGGSAYAISYTDQKRAESYQGGEKPQIEWVGHYHKFNYGYPREIHAHQGGCTCDQTMFMRKKRLQAMVGFNTVEITQSPEDGAITRYAPEFFPRFDRGYYRRSFE